MEFTQRTRVISSFVILASAAYAVFSTGLDHRSIGKALTSLRQAGNSKIDLLLPNPHSAILKGIIFGDKSALPKQLTENLRKTGTIHIVVASGYNLSVAGLYFSSIATAIINPKRRVLLFFLTELCLLVYVAMIGFQAPIIRAFVMSSLAILGKIFGRERSGIWLLCVSFLIMVAISPSFIIDISFQLSFLATFGIMLFAEQLKNVLSNFFKKIKLIRWFGLTVLIDDLATTLAAIAFTWPLISYYFGNVSLIAPLVNVLVLWTVPILMVYGSLALFLPNFLSIVSSFIAWFLTLLLDYFLVLINFFGGLNISSLDLEVSLPFLSFYFGFLLVLGFNRENGEEK